MNKRNPDGETKRMVLEHIATHIDQNGYSPSVREIGKALGISSSSTVHTHLRHLAEEGKIAYIPNWPRTIRIRKEQ